MSSLKNAAKTTRSHRGRHQPESRKHLGLLESKRDYKLRAKDYNSKKDILKRLRQKALNKNPDEFYYHMINSETKDGVHYEKAKDEVLTPEQLHLMQTQDLKYVVHKRSIEKKKIQKLRATLHLLDNDEKSGNSHTFFVKSEKETKNFDVAERLGTHQSLLGRTYNRPRLEDLSKTAQFLNLEEDVLTDVQKKQKAAYKELVQRIKREKQLTVLQEKMEVKMRMNGKKKETPEAVVKEETKDSAAVVRWPKERKR